MLYAVMRPDNVNEPFPVFTRFGRLTSNLDTAMGKAKACSGKVYEVDAANSRLIRSFYVEPAPICQKHHNKVRRSLAQLFTA